MRVLGILFLVQLALLVVVGLVILVGSMDDLRRYLRIRRM